MTSRSLLERVGEPLLRSEQFTHKHAESAAPAGFIIALSREVGALGTTVARALGQRLGWSVYDHELVEQVAQDMNLRTRLLETLDERPGHWLAEIFEAFSSRRIATEFTYVEHLLQTLLALAARGNCILVGRGAAQVLSGDRVLRVRLTAPLEDRIAVIARQFVLDREAALRHIESTAHDRLAFIKEHFKRDPTDPDGYDLIVNTGRFTVTEATDIIVGALRCLQARVASAT